MNQSQDRQAAALLFFSISSFALSYATSIVVARALGADGFDDYAVAVSAAAIFATLAEMGTGKYAIRIIPAYFERGAWSLARGYCRFSAGVVLAASVILSLFVLASSGFGGGGLGHRALSVVVLFLPAMALVGAGAEFVMANQAAVRAAFVTRILVPGSTLAILAAWSLAPYELTASRGAIGFGAGWLIGLLAVWVYMRQTTPEPARTASPEYEAGSWIVSALPFVTFALMITVLAKTGVIVLEIVSPMESTVAVYAAAVDTGTFIYIVAKSTDKLFLPGISVMIERKDAAGLRRLRRRRWAWMGFVCAVFLAIVFVSGREILSLFGPEFAQGHAALCIIAVATSVWTLTSISPSYLKYVKRNRFVIASTGIALAAHVALCVPLGSRLGATGAALSYAIPVIALYGILALTADLELRKLAASADMETSDSLVAEDRDEYTL